MKKLFVDSRTCLGCHFCEIICSLTHLGNEVNPKKARIRVREDIANHIFKPVVCQACKKPKCVEACEHDAIHQDPKLKIPIIDAEKCTGCQACLKACPFDAIFYDAGEQIPLVCDLCGGDPQCVKYCPNHPTKTHTALNFTSPQHWAKVKAGPSETNLQDTGER